MLSELLQGGERNEAVLAISLFAQVVGLSEVSHECSRVLEMIPIPCHPLADLAGEVLLLHMPEEFVDAEECFMAEVAIWVAAAVLLEEAATVQLQLQRELTPRLEANLAEVLSRVGFADMSQQSLD